MIFFADTLDRTLSLLLMRLDIDQEQIRERHQITDSNQNQKTAEKDA